LCKAYTLLAELREPTDNFAKAIAACETGLARISPNSYPRTILYASLKGAAGEAYSQLALRQNVDTNSDKAVTLISEALALISRSKEPVLFADFHSALASALLLKAYRGGPEGASEALRKKRWTQAVLSMVCALVIYDQLDRASDALGAARLLQTIQSRSAPDLKTFVNYIAREKPPEGCSQEAAKIPTLFAKWLK
jgi:tetratricopeptide (TPR) repeat protein